MNKNRLAAIYADEVERWRAAWQRFEMDLCRPLLKDELRAFFDGRKAKSDAALVERVDCIVDVWEREVGLPENGLDWHAFFIRFDAAVPDRLGTPRLSLWPGDVPKAPPDNGTAARLWEICQRDKGKGADERIAAGWTLMHLASLRYSREVIWA